MATSTVNPDQGWDSTVAHVAPPQTWDTTTNHVAATPPAGSQDTGFLDYLDNASSKLAHKLNMQPMPRPQPGGPQDTGVLDYLGNTSRKVAEKLNYQNILEGIGRIDDALSPAHRDYGEAWEAAKDLVPFAIRHPYQAGVQIGQQLSSGDYSGATSELITDALMAHGAHETVRAMGVVPTSASPTVSDAAEAPPAAPGVIRTAAKGAAQGVLAANKGGLTNPMLGVAAGTGAVLTPIIGHEAAAGVAGAIKAGHTLVSAVRGAKAELADRAAAQARDAAAAQNRAEGNTPGWQAGGAQPTPAAAPAAAPAPVQPIAPDVADLAAKRTARQAVNAKILEARAQQAAAATAPEADPVLVKMKEIAQGFGVKNFAKLPAAEQVNLRRLASRVVEDEKAAAAGAQAAPVSPPVAAAGAVPEAAATQTPSTTAPVTPASPVVPAPVPARQNVVSPAVAEPPLPGRTESPSQPTVAPEAIPSARSTAHVPPRSLEYYPSGRPEHIPTPGELGHGTYVPEDTELNSSVLEHQRAENEKGYNAAHYAYSTGITDPKIFDDMTEAQKRAFMNGTKEEPGQPAEPGALQHGREVGNPTPKTQYQVNKKTGSMLDGKTLDLAKAHLAKMVDEGGPAAPQQALPAPETAAQTVERLRKRQQKR
jgi:hypothetical protein